MRVSLLRHGSVTEYAWVGSMTWKEGPGGLVNADDIVFAGPFTADEIVGARVEIGDAVVDTSYPTRRIDGVTTAEVRIPAGALILTPRVEVPV